MKLGSSIPHSDQVRAVLEAAIDAADPYRAVLDALKSAPLPELERGGKVYVLGAGKAGEAMARAAEDFIGESIAAGLVLVKTAQVPGASPLRKIALLEAGHPVPDRRGAEGALGLMELAGSAREGDLVLCLISGGGSALLTSPSEGITLEDLQAVTRLLLRAGATINELNAVRKHLSTIAGGRLARQAAPARVLSLILSDVIGSPLDVIASGPTAPDPTTYAQALAVLEYRGIVHQVPAAVIAVLRRGSRGELPETPKPGDPLLGRVTNVVVASNLTAVEAAAATARGLGLETLIASTYLEGEACEAGTVLAGIAKEIAANGRPVHRPACVLFGGETTVTVRGSGQGGRNSELAVGAAIALDGWGAGVLVASLATDGGDGASPGAGAVADGTTLDRARAMGLEAWRSLADNDTYTFMNKLDAGIETGPTGTNVNDVMALFVF